ncbi:MAG: outer membrane lipoprotein carrier protein LolA [Deltaproteobacteria bacterium]|nr:outer membrane lipoprotein carrier protein LolA [Deltaproteobacteria bacterium]
MNTDGHRCRRGFAGDRVVAAVRTTERRSLARVVLFAALAAGAMLAGAGWGESWEAIREAAASVRTVRASFVQEKRLPILTRPLRSEGTFAFRRPGSIRWEYRMPVESVLLTDGGDVRRYTKRDGEWAAEAGAGMEAMRVVLDEVAAWMSGRFDESAAFAATLSPGTPTTIELTPREEAIGRFVTRILVTLAETPGAVASIEIFEGAEASTRIEFQGMELNVELGDALFTAP